MAVEHAPIVATRRLLTLSIAALIIGFLLFKRTDHLVPWQQWLGLLSPHGPNTVQRIILRDMVLPRVASSLLGGAAIGLAGALFQSILRNRLAEPSTLGVSAGAQLAMMMAMLWAPSALEHGTWVATAGGAVSFLLVLSISWRNRFSSLSMIIAGLMVGLAAGTFGALLVLFNHENLSALMTWQRGLLALSGWYIPGWFTVQLLLCAAGSALIIRPLGLLDLGDEQAHSLGASVNLIRILGIGIGVFISACAVNAIGAVSFVGLAAPTLARACGARSIGRIIAWSMVTGALLLCLSDQLLQAIPGLSQPIPTGSAMAPLAVPLMLWILARTRSLTQSLHLATYIRAAVSTSGARMLWGLLGTVILCVAIGLLVGQSTEGWTVAFGAELKEVLPWRAPRVFGAMAAGGLFGISGAVLQRMTGNPLASPDVLGISAGASLGLIAFALLGKDISLMAMLCAAMAGTLVAMILVMVLCSRAGYAADRLLLIGISLSTLTSSVVALVIATGDPRSGMILGWMAGSTYFIEWPQVIVACTTLALDAGELPLVSRWLDILPLGDVGARALGVPVGRSKLLLFLFVSVSTATATLLSGPLTFVGLLAPHITRLLGFRHALVHLVATAAGGAALMVMADWLGRNLLFPWQIPAGLVATAVGCLAFLWMVSR